MVSKRSFFFLFYSPYFIFILAECGGKRSISTIFPEPVPSKAEEEKVKDTQEADAEKARREYAERKAAAKEEEDRRRAAKEKLNSQAKTMPSTAGTKKATLASRMAGLWNSKQATADKQNESNIFSNTYKGGAALKPGDEVLGRVFENIIILIYS